MIATLTHPVKKRQCQKILPRKMIIHHEVVSHPNFFASGRVDYICQFSTFYKKKIFAWSNGAHVKRSAILGGRIS